jgi:hypothetical protein
VGCNERKGLKKPLVSLASSGNPEKKQTTIFTFSIETHCPGAIFNDSPLLYLKEAFLPGTKNVLQLRIIIYLCCYNLDLWLQQNNYSMLPHLN